MDKHQELFKTLAGGQMTEDHVHERTKKRIHLSRFLDAILLTLHLIMENTSVGSGVKARAGHQHDRQGFRRTCCSVAEQLIKGLKQKTGQQERMGEIIGTIKRQALIDG